MLIDPWEQIVSLRRDGRDLVVITITATRGSVLGQVGAEALAFAHDFLHGTDPCLTVTWNL